MLTLVFIILFFTVIELPALVVLGFWFVEQAVFGASDLTNPTGSGGGVAYFAHIGGFVFGLPTIRLLATKRKQVPPRYRRFTDRSCASPSSPSRWCSSSALGVLTVRDIRNNGVTPIGIDHRAGAVSSWSASSARSDILHANERARSVLQEGRAREPGGAAGIRTAAAGASQATSALAEVGSVRSGRRRPGRRRCCWS